MRVVVIGATGNTGTSVLDALRRDPAVDEIVGVARRRPDVDIDRVTWATADIATDDLTAVVKGADAVVHLAWLIQPSRDERVLWDTNVVGTRRLLDAVAAARVPAFVYASSIGAYSPAPVGAVVDEDWPTDGIAGSPYSRQKAYIERVLDGFSLANPDIRVVRLRPGLILKPEAATHTRQLFAGPLLPTPLLRRIGLPVWPRTRGLRLQFVHTDDVAQAYRLAVVGDAAGAFNVAADPVVDAKVAARALHAFAVPIPPRVLRAGAAVTWHLRLQPADPGWIDLALNAPVMATDRARSVLGWSPTRDADAVLAEFVRAVGENAGGDTPPLDPASSGPARSSELATGIGARP